MFKEKVNLHAFLPLNLEEFVHLLLTIFLIVHKNYDKFSNYLMFLVIYVLLF